MSDQRTTPSTTADLAAIREREAKATPGPWRRNTKWAIGGDATHIAQAERKGNAP